MPKPNVEDAVHETIEAPFRISFGRVVKIATPLILLILILSFWFVYFYIPKQIETSNQTLHIPDTKTATSSAKPATSAAKKDEKAGWETYKDSKYKFSIRYPPGLDFNVNEGSNPTAAESPVNKLLTFKKSEEILRVFFDFQGGLPLPIGYKCNEGEDLKIGTYTTKGFICKKPNEITIVYSKSFASDKIVGGVVIVYDYSDPKTAETFKNILSTFRFIN